MIVLLIFWVCASSVLCLALLGVAARRAPRVGEQPAVDCDLALEPEMAVELQQAKPACRPCWAILPPPSLPAKTKTSSSSLLPAVDPAHPAVLACHLGA